MQATNHPKANFPQGDNCPGGNYPRGNRPIRGQFAGVG